MMKLSKGYSHRGADMGRRSSSELVSPVRVERVMLDSGGYDSGGAYWGTGNPLFRGSDQEGNEVYFRSANQEEARRRCAEEYGVTVEATEIAGIDIDEAVASFIEAGLWSTRNPDDESEEDLLAYHPSEQFERKARDLVLRFLTENAETVKAARCLMANETKSSQFGYDLWMTIGGHGVGFWETSDWSAKEGRKLSDACDNYAELNLWVNADSEVEAD